MAVGRAPRWAALPVTSWTPPARRTVIVAPHPDDEVLGCGGLIAYQRHRDRAVLVLAVTDGEGAEISGVGPGRLADTRRREQSGALRRLGVAPSNTVRLGLPDTAVADHERRLTEHLVSVIQPDDLVVAPWEHDVHPDHEACGRAARRAVESAPALLVASLVWAPVRRPPEPDLSGPLLRVDLDPDASTARALAMEEHRSQLDDDHGVAIVADELLERFAEPAEYFVAVTATSDRAA